MDIAEAPGMAYCSYRVPRVGEGALWPSQARQGALRRFDAEHPPQFCQERTAAILVMTQEVGSVAWVGTLCAEHLTQYAHLHEHVYRAPKQPLRLLAIYTAEGYLGTAKPRQPRTWHPR